MSVLIRGMEMPKSCDVCCFDLFVESCPLYNATPEELVGITWIKKARHRYCPLVEIPPHGRLIDADALEDRCSRQATDEWNKSTGTNWGYAYATFESDVEDAPTIIESEEEDG